MRPRLKRVHSPDAEDLGSYVPPNSEHFGVLVQLMIGPPDDGEESFDVVVCSPRWLLERVEESDLVDLRHHLLVAAWDWPLILRHVEGVLSQIDEPTWPEVAQRVGRLGRWEFEDYHDG